MCSASAGASADTVYSMSTVWFKIEQSLWQMSRDNSLHYITLGHKTITVLTYSERIGMQCYW